MTELNNRLVENKIYTDTQNKLINLADEFINDSFTSTEYRKKLMQNTKKFRRELHKSNIIDYTPYSLSYLYFLCEKDEEQFFTILPQVLQNNPIIALMYISFSVSSEGSYVSMKMNADFIPHDLTQKIYSMCQDAILANTEYCNVYIMRNVSPTWKDYKSFDSVIQMFLNKMYIIQFNNLLELNKTKPSKIIKLFYAFYPLLNEDDIKNILQALLKTIHIHNRNEFLYKDIISKIEAMFINCEFESIDIIKSRLLLKEL